MAGGSAKAVYAAIGANSAVAVAKFAAFFMTGSGAMLSEGIHSLADVGNQTLLAVGISRSKREPDEDHPMGYEREQFTWALISAVGIFFLGCGVTVMHGIHTWQEPHPPEGMGISFAVLAFSFLVEGWSFYVAIKAVQASAAASGMGFFEYVRDGSDPMAVAVVSEDSVAVGGVLIATVGLLLAHFTQNGRWDAVASIAIGLTMGWLALFLIRKNKAHLVGKSVDAKQREAVRKVLEDDPVVENVRRFKALVTGADSARLSAEIDFDGRVVAHQVLKDKDLDAELASLTDTAVFRSYLEDFGEQVLEQLGDEVDRVERSIQSAVPSMKRVDLEAD